MKRLITRFIRVFVFMAVMLASLPVSEAASWYWLSSDSKYSKFFDTSSVKVVNSVKTAKGEIPTAIEAWIKTGFSYAGAAETINAYELKSIIPNPATLSYSLALVRINPQDRTIKYVKENFYDSKDNVIWSKVNEKAREKEINSREFDEEYYCAIVDEVFRHGEGTRRIASDRWIPLWNYEDNNGMKVSSIADTTTFRQKGDNLFFWEWQEAKDSKGNVLEIKFLKKVLNLPQGSVRILQARYWSPNTKWQDMGDQLDGSYHMIESDTPSYKGLVKLRAFAKGYSTWVHRYQLPE